MLFSPARDARILSSLGSLDGCASIRAELNAASAELETLRACEAMLLFEQGFAQSGIPIDHIEFHGDHEGGYISSFLLRRSNGSFASTSDIVLALYEARDRAGYSKPAPDANIPLWDIDGLAQEFGSIDFEAFDSFDNSFHLGLNTLLAHSRHLFFRACDPLASFSKGSASHIATELGLHEVAALLEQSALAQACPAPACDPDSQSARSL